MKPSFVLIFFAGFETVRPHNSHTCSLPMNSSACCSIGWAVASPFPLQIAIHSANSLATVCRSAGSAADCVRRLLGPPAGPPGPSRPSATPSAPEERRGSWRGGGGNTHFWKKHDKKKTKSCRKPQIQSNAIFRDKLEQKCQKMHASCILKCWGNADSKKHGQEFQSQRRKSTESLVSVGRKLFPICFGHIVELFQKELKKLTKNTDNASRKSAPPGTVFAMRPRHSSVHFRSFCVMSCSSTRQRWTTTPANSTICRAAGEAGACSASVSFWSNSCGGRGTGYGRVLDHTVMRKTANCLILNLSTSFPFCEVNVKVTFIQYLLFSYVLYKITDTLTCFNR